MGRIVISMPLAVRSVLSAIETDKVLDQELGVQNRLFKACLPRDQVTIAATDQRAINVKSYGSLKVIHSTKSLGASSKFPFKYRMFNHTAPPKKAQDSSVGTAVFHSCPLFVHVLESIRV